MPDKPFYPSRMESGFVDCSDDADLPRGQIEPHYCQEPDGSVIMVVPGGAITMADLNDLRTGDARPVIRIRAADSPIALAVILMPGEMRTLGQMMVDRANAIEAKAAAKAREFFAQSGKKGDA